MKVSLNFPEEQRKRLSEIFCHTLTKQELVKSYLEKIEDEIKILDLKEFIQHNYCKLQHTNDHETPLRDICIIEELSSLMLPEEKISNLHYQSNAKALILYFFELCYIGKKTEDEQQQTLSLFY
jgi:hypothetical protein